MQRAAVAAGEVARVVEDAGAVDDPGLPLALVVGLGPALAGDLAALADGLGSVLPALVVERSTHSATRSSSSLSEKCAPRVQQPDVRRRRRRCPGSRCRRCTSSWRSARSGRSGTPGRRRQGPGTRSRRGERRDRPRARREPYPRRGNDCARYRGGMRLGVLDIGSNTGHLLVVDAYRGAAPMPASSYKEELRLAEHLEKDGDVTQRGDRRPHRVRRQRPDPRRGQGLRGDLLLRHLGGARRGQLRRRARPRRGPHRRTDQGAAG